MTSAAKDVTGNNQIILLRALDNRVVRDIKSLSDL